MTVTHFESLKITSFILAGLFFLLPNSYGQDVLTPKGMKAPTSRVEKEAVPHRFGHHKKLSASFSGHLIELIQSEVPLNRDYAVFNHFGNIHYSKLKDGAYSYTIEVKFATRKEMRKFLNNVVKPNAPDARLVYYRTGKRKVLR